ncbi:hypothetical protein GW17_00058392 [Ensete ventricosum]|nr:hypothetical protein GW17_00058392 [Ensete ventricosum]
MLLLRFPNNGIRAKPARAAALRSDRQQGVSPTRAAPVEVLLARTALANWGNHPRAVARSTIACTTVAIVAAG